MSGTEVSRPKRYFIFHFLLLRFLGLGWWHQPEEGDIRNFPGWYIYYSIVTQTVWVAGFVGLETIDPFVGEKEMDRFMFSLSFVITHNLTIIKLYIFIFRNKDIQEVVRTLQIDLYEFYQNNKTNRNTIRITKIFTFMFIAFGWITIGNSSIYGAVQDFHWRAIGKNLSDTEERPVRNLPQPIYIPWNYQQDKSFIPTYILETTGLLWTGHIVMGIDTFIGSVILHMSSQFAILGEGLITAYDRTMKQLREGARRDSEENISIENLSILDETEENERIVRAFYTDNEIGTALQTTLRNCFRQHQVLIGCVEKFATTYSYGFMTQLLSSMAAICVVMVQVSQDASSLKSVRLVTSLAFFLAMITQLAIQCFTGNELTLQAARISDAVMQCKWERMPARLRPLLLMMMVRAQRPLRLNAAGFAYMDNDCFLAVLSHRSMFQFIRFTDIGKGLWDSESLNLHYSYGMSEMFTYVISMVPLIMKAAYSYYAVLSQKQV